jgi:outer membrane protein assembly factor BamA
VNKRLWPAAIALVIYSGLLSAQGTDARVTVRNVRFENVTHLSPEQQTQLVEIASRLEFRADAASTLEQAAQEAYADKGYWHVKLKAEFVTVGWQDDVTLRALDEGRPYKLATLRWSGVTAFPEADLATLIPLRPGKVLERSKIVEGTEAIRRLYLSGGYLSSVAVPEVEMNELDGSAELHISVKEGGVFTVQGFDVIGVNPALRTRLVQAWPFRPGDVYRGDNIENFISNHAALLPTAVSPDVVCRTVDLSNRTVEFVLDFRPQPQACESGNETQVTKQGLLLMGSNP